MELKTKALDQVQPPPSLFTGVIDTADSRVFDVRFDVSGTLLRIDYWRKGLKPAFADIYNGGKVLSDIPDCSWETGLSSSNQAFFIASPAPGFETAIILLIDGNHVYEHAIEFQLTEAGLLVKKYLRGIVAFPGKVEAVHGNHKGTLAVAVFDGETKVSVFPILPAQVYEGDDCSYVNLIPLKLD